MGNSIETPDKEEELALDNENEFIPEKFNLIIFSILRNKKYIDDLEQKDILLDNLIIKHKNVFFIDHKYLETHTLKYTANYLKINFTDICEIMIFHQTDADSRFLITLDGLDFNHQKIKIFLTSKYNQTSLIRTIEKINKYNFICIIDDTNFYETVHNFYLKN